MDSLCNSDNYIDLDLSNWMSDDSGGLWCTFIMNVDRKWLFVAGSKTNQKRRYFFTQCIGKFSESFPQDPIALKLPLSSKKTLDRQNCLATQWQTPDFPFQDSISCCTISILILPNMQFCTVLFSTVLTVWSWLYLSCPCKTAEKLYCSFQHSH